MKISLIVPVHNMGSHIPGLCRSLDGSGVLQNLEEILIVDDGSKDSTPTILRDLSDSSDLFKSKIKILSLPTSHGRFYARWAGAQASQGDILFFIDARTTFPPGAGAQLQMKLNESLLINMTPRIDTGRNIYGLYWERSHEALFSHHYKALAQGPLWLTVDNYDQYLKGTGGLIVPKKEFMTVCEKYLNCDIKSDDTLIMKELVAFRPLLMDADFYYYWQPRDRLLPFLGRLIERGPGLIEYHVMKRRGWVFWSVMAGLLVQLIWFSYLIVAPLGALRSLLLLAIGATFTVVLFARRPREALKLAPLHLAVILSFGFGVWYGLVYHVIKAVKGNT